MYKPGQRGIFTGNVSGFQYLIEIKNCYDVGRDLDVLVLKSLLETNNENHQSLIRK